MARQNTEPLETEPEEGTEAADESEDSGDEQTYREMMDADDSYEGLSDEDVLADEGNAPGEAQLNTGGETLDDGEPDEGDGDEAARGDEPQGDEPQSDEPQSDAQNATPSQPRDEQGKFTKGEQPAQGTPAPAGAAAAAPSKPEPLMLRIDKAMHPIEEAQVSRVNGHHLFIVKDADVARFHRRLQNGIQGERMARQLRDGLKEPELQRSAPSPKSDAEIEAEITLKAIEDHLPTILDERDLELLRAKVELAKRTTRDEYERQMRTRRDEAAKPERDAEARVAEDRQELEAMADHVLAVVRNTPELQGITPDQIKAAYRELNDVRRSAFWKEGQQYFANNTLIVKHLLAAKAQAAASATPAPAGTTASQPSKAQQDAARFNRGAASAAKPTSTSVKNNRGKQPSSRPRGSGTTGTGSNAGKPSKTTKTPAMDAEDTYRQKERRWLNSDTLDMGDDD